MTLAPYYSKQLSIHPSIFFCLSGVGSWGQEPKQGTVEARIRGLDTPYSPTSQDRIPHATLNTFPHFSGSAKHRWTGWVNSSAPSISRVLEGAELVHYCSSWSLVLQYLWKDFNSKVEECRGTHPPHPLLKKSDHHPGLPIHWYCPRFPRDVARPYNIQISSAYFISLNVKTEKGKGGEKKKRIFFRSAGQLKEAKAGGHNEKFNRS